MSDTKTGQVASSAAAVYEEFFVPALFAEWAPRVCDAAIVGEGDQVLDVACGTGVLARTARARVGPGGGITGVDLNDGMLAVAARQDPAVSWQRAPAEDLPFESESFDVAVSQFGLMFFTDQAEAMSEMHRVVRAGGRITVAVWADLRRAPGYEAMAQLLDRLFGAEAADALRVPYSLGDVDVLRSIFAAAGLDGSIETLSGRACFPSIEAWVHTDVRGWTLAEMISDDEYDELLGAARRELAQFIADDGSVTFEHPAHLVTATVR